MIAQAQRARSQRQSWSYHGVVADLIATTGARHLGDQVVVPVLAATAALQLIVV